jgi:1-phosphatidylinositol-3-phosphate 5-kinase
VCNLCLKIMEEYKDDAEDDRRSINSASTNFRLPGISDRAFMDAAVSPDMLYAKSPFAASQLFSSNPNESLSAIDESSVPTRWGVPSEADLSRPVTPNASGTPEGEDDHIWTMRVPKTAAPFRRPMDEDAKDGDAQSGHEDSASESTSPAPASPHQKSEAHSPAESSQANKRRPSRATFPRSDTSSTDGGLGIRVPLSRVDSNVPLIGLRTRLSSKASQGGLTALLDPEKSEGLWRARSHSLVQRPEILAGASLRHFEVMLGQAIQKSGLPNPAEWHQVLSKLLLKVSTNLHPNVRAGDSIDVRAFVKIKKVPGGRISDSEYVDGIVISKNVTHKAMPRRLVSPRIMVVTFPLDYHRVERQFMSLDPILAQEKDYLRLLTRRIIDVRPHIVLVERAASRIALDYLREANIAVARNVKVSAIRQVARCTQADVVASMDRLALEPRLGRCAEFQIQSFEHDLIPGRRKTLMRFEGCHRDYGCTIILRGGDLETLRKVKVVADFMALVVYHLKSEIILYCDEHNILPPRPPLPLEYQDLLDTLTTSPQSQHDRTDSATVDEKSDISELESPALRTPTANGDDGVHAERHQAFVLTRDIAQSLEPYLTLALSASAAIRFPPPATLAKMAMLDRSLNALQHSRDEEEAAQILHEENISPDTARNATINSGTAISTSTPVRDASETVSSGIASSTAMSAAPTVAVPPRDVVRDPYRVLRKPEEIARESKLAQVEHEHSEQVKLWQWYTKRHVNILRPEDFQGIVYVYSLGCEGCEKPCVEPRSQHINFYQPDDLTIGQYLEGLASDAVKRCPSKACDRLLLFHFRLLAHGDRRLQIAMDQFSCPSPGHEDQIITWSYCRLCATPSPTTIMRDETWEMSWGTYLEHCFYPPETSAGFACPHDAYRDQIRYFAHLNLAIRIHNESIDLFEPVRPSITLQVKPETKVVLKNQEYESALQKNTAFFDSVLFRLRSFDYELVQPEMVRPLRIDHG